MIIFPFFPPFYPRRLASSSRKNLGCVAGRLSVCGDVASHNQTQVSTLHVDETDDAKLKETCMVLIFAGVSLLPGPADEPHLLNSSKRPQPIR